MQIRHFFAIAILSALPKVAGAQFTTFIPPQAKLADSVKAVVAAGEKARVDSTNVGRITNMKVWVDSAAGVLPTPTTRADSLAAGVPATDSARATADSVTMPNGTRAPATASPLPLVTLAGLFLIVIGGVLVRGAPLAKRRA
jgi:hypothetical protein